MEIFVHIMSCSRSNEGTFSLSFSLLAFSDVIESELLIVVSDFPDKVLLSMVGTQRSNRLLKVDIFRHLRFGNSLTTSSFNAPLTGSMAKSKLVVSSNDVCLFDMISATDGLLRCCGICGI